MRLRSGEKAGLIGNVPLFSSCTKRELAALAAEADELAVGAGTELTRQGSPGREFVVIVEGAAAVDRDGRTIAHLGAGDFVGEIALLTGGPRTATVTTTEPSRLLVLGARSFDRVAKRIPSVQSRLLTAVAERLARETL